MITRTSEYALRAVIFLAGEEGRCVASREIAESTKVPAGYLPKVLQSLTRAGLLTAQRGLRGGYMLSKPPSELFMLEVLNSISPISRIQCCPLDVREAVVPCPLHQRLHGALVLAEESLGKVTIANLADEMKEVTPPCWGPTAV